MGMAGVGECDGTPVDWCFGICLSETWDLVPDARQGVRPRSALVPARHSRASETLRAQNLHRSEACTVAMGWLWVSRTLLALWQFLGINKKRGPPEAGGEHAAARVREQVWRGLVSVRSACCLVFRYLFAQTWGGQARAWCQARGQTPLSPCPGPPQSGI